MRLLSIILTIIIFLNTAGFAKKEKAKDSARDNRYRKYSSQINLFGEVFTKVNKKYVEEIDAAEFIEAGIRGMLETLDPYTVYYEPDKVKDLEDITKGQYSGVGIEIGLTGKDKRLTIISPIEDTPAAHVGLRAGDFIIAVDGRSAKGFTTIDAAKYIRGEEGTEVTLTIERKGFDQPLEYTLTRAIIPLHDVAFSGIIDDGIGYIKMVRFSSHASSELREALKDVLVHEPQGLILDLRSNPGGLLPSAIQVSEEFLPAGYDIVSTRGRDQRSTRNFKSGGKPLATDLPLVVLVNRGSASASEIVSGAIQDHDRGVIIGEQTFGKGLVQSVLSLSGGAALKITTARYYTPSGRLIQRKDYFDDAGSEIVEGFEIDTTTGKTDTSVVDSSVTKYFTDSGREVFGGGGITPDIIVEPTLPDPVGVEMIRQQLFFLFVDEWIARLGQPDTVEVSDEMLADFDSFIDSLGFIPSYRGEDQLKALQKIGEADSLGSEYLSLLKELETTLKRGSDRYDSEIEDFIRLNIDRELASAIGGREWRIRASFNGDVQLTEAISILKDREHYSALLREVKRADVGEIEK